MTKIKSKLHPYQNTVNWIIGGSCVFWNKETHVLAKYEQMQKELERGSSRRFISKRQRN